jgi:multiple sugar transport system ATP-binding protein
MAAIKFDKVTKQYGKVQAIKEVTLAVKDREFMVLVGPSGCGKSTLLRMIAGLEEISTGELYIGDQMVNELPPKDRDIAIVFQNYALYPHMTAYENMAFGLKIRGTSKAVIEEKVMNAAAILGIEDLLDRKPKAMSGGQRQRIAIGRAIVREPRVFLFDEPLSNLDAKLRGQMRLEIARLHKKLQTTVVYVTHDQVEAMTLGDRIAVINQGIIQQVDTPDNLYRFPKNRFVAGFIGTPPMNFLEGKIMEEEGDIVFRTDTGELSVSVKDHAEVAALLYQKVTLGIRPEHIHASAAKAGPKAIPFSAYIPIVERLGHECYAFLAIGDQQISARLLSEEVSTNLPATMNLYIERDKIHFFSAETGESLDNSTKIN